MIEIPLSNSPSRKFSIVINKVSYVIEVMLSSRTGIWSMNVSQNGTKLVDGISLVCGVDLFKQYNFAIKNAYVVNLENSSSDPSKTNLGSKCKLIILTDEEIENAEAI